MKQFSVALLAFGAALSAAGCHKTGSNAGRDLSELCQSAPISTAQDVAAAQVGVASAGTFGGFTKRGYVTNSAIDMYEIQAGRIALQRSASPRMKMMIADHVKLSVALKSTLQHARIAATVKDRLQAVEL